MSARKFNENQSDKRIRRAQTTGRDIPDADQGTQFFQTKVRFREFSNYEKPLTYEEWMAAPDECKAAILYVQFYDQITLAWMKTKSTYTDINDGVSEVLQYLNKNVEKIKADGKRFTPNYIYKVAYNCLSCLSWNDPALNIRCRTYQNECSNLVSYGEDELDLFDTIIEDEDDRDSKFDLDGSRAYLSNATKMWDIVEDMGQKAKLVVAKLLGEASYTPKELSSVSEEETAEILEELRTRLAGFVGVFG